MTNRTHEPTALDLRVKSGLKIVATGDEAGAYTMNQLKATSYLARAICACELRHRDFIDAKRIEALGWSDQPLSRVAPHLKLDAPCGAKVTVEIVDPWRDNLDP